MFVLLIESGCVLECDKCEVGCSHVSSLGESDGIGMSLAIESLMRFNGEEERGCRDAARGTGVSGERVCVLQCIFRLTDSGYR